MSERLVDSVCKEASGRKGERELKPICIDMFCGLGGWAEGFLAEGWQVIGFDIEWHDYGTGGYPGELVLQDVLTLHGSQFKNAACIVASPPCQGYSYRAMPWKRAKALPPPDNTLFEACFRIQQEACEAAGRYIPLIVENVKGAQPWVGRARANFGSFYLWGDVGRVGNRVVALCGKIGSDVGIRAVRANKVPGFRFDGSGRSFQSESVKVTGQNWSNYAKTGTVSPHWRMEAFKNDGGSWFAVAHNTASGTNRNPVREGVKQQIPGNQGWFGKYKPGCQGTRNYGSKSTARKKASAMIAKIPYPLALHIARTFKPAAGTEGKG